MNPLKCIKKRACCTCNTHAQYYTPLSAMFLGTDLYTDRYKIMEWL